MFFEEVFLKILQYSQESTCAESLLNTIAGLQPCNYIKKYLQHRCFPVNIVKFLRTSILRNICEQMLLKFNETVF